MTVPLRLVDPLVPATSQDRRTRWLAFAAQAALDEQRYDGNAELYRTLAAGLPEGSLERSYMSETASGFAVLAEAARDAKEQGQEYADGYLFPPYTGEPG